MSDLKHLPNAWKIIYKMDGEEGNEKDGLYEIYYQISTAIFNYRLKHNFSQKKLAKILGVTQAMVSKLESGDYNYTIEQLWKVSQKLGFKLAVQMEEAEDMEDDYIIKDSQADIIPAMMAVGS